MTNENVLGYIRQAFELKKQNCYKQAIEMLYKALEIECDNVEILFQLGELYYLLKNYSRSVQYLEKVVSKNPEHVDALKLLKSIYLDEGNIEKAYECAKKYNDVVKNDESLSGLISIMGKLGRFDEIKIIEEQPDLSIDVLYSIAKVYYDADDLVKAKCFLEKAYEMDSCNEEVLTLLGKIYFDENEFDKSREIFSKFSANTSNPEALNFQGLYALEDMKFVDAIKFFSRACNAVKTNARYFYNLGNAYFYNGWFEEAVNAYLNAVRLAQDNLDYRYSLAYLYFEMKKFDKAQGEVDYILSIDSKHPQAIVLSALLKLHNKDFLGAQNILEDNLRRGVDDDFTLTSLARVYVELGLCDKAEETLKKIISRNPGNLNYVSQLAEVYIKENKAKDALELVDEILKDNENYILAYALGARAAYEQNDFDKVKEFAREAISLDMNYSQGYYYLALVRAKEEDFEEAIECMKRAIMYDVNNPKYYAEMSNIYKESGDIKNALEYIKEAENISGATEYKIRCSELAALNRKNKNL